MVNETLVKSLKHAPVNHGKVNSLLNETTKTCTAETRESEFTAVGKPNGTSEPSTAETEKCELRGE